MDRYVAEEIAAPMFGSIAVVVRTDREDRFLSVETVGFAFSRQGALAKSKRAAVRMAKKREEAHAIVVRLLKDGRKS